MQITAMGDRIREARSRLGLTQNGVADALQVSSQAVSKWERGENAPDIAALPDLANLLGVTTDWLLGTTAPDGPTAHSTAVFADMKGFLKRVRNLPASDMATLLNAHFYEVTETMLRYDAVPVKYIGDAFLCFFAGTGHEERALRAALHAQSLASEPIAVGVSSGDIFIGRVGHPLHASLDIIGETVNNAALAEQMCTVLRKPIVATDSTVTAVGDAFTFERLDIEEGGRIEQAIRDSKLSLYSVGLAEGASD